MVWFVGGGIFLVDFCEFFSSMSLNSSSFKKHHKCSQEAVVKPVFGD